MREEVILIGGGGHALSLAESVLFPLKGYMAMSKSESLPHPWLGNDSEAPIYIKEGYPFHMAFVYSEFPVMSSRGRLIKKYKDMGAHFVTLKSPSAIVTPNSEVGDGCALMCGVIVNRARLGEHVVVNSGAIIEHDCIIGDNTFIGPGAIIGGFTMIGSDCFIGLGAKIKNGITIADGVSVGMGTIVTKDLLEPGIYHGNPLKHIVLPRNL